MKDASTGSYRQEERGSSTLEILIAFVILTISLTAVITIVFGNQTVSANTQIATEALYRAKAVLEAARASSRSDFYGLTATSSTETVGPLTYTKSLAVSDVAPFTRQATSTISWSEGGRTLSVVLSTVLTNPQSLLGGDTCSPVLEGDWTAPQDFKGGYGYADITSNTGATGLDVAGQRVYLTSNPSSSGQSDFYVIDVSNPKPAGLDLPILGSFNTTYGLTDVRVGGRYAFVSGDDRQHQFLVIDKNNPASMSIVASMGFTSITDSAIGNTIFYDYKNRLVYLGLTKSTSTEIRIIDVSDPTAPSQVGTYETGNSINQIVVEDGVAYLTLCGTSCGGSSDQVLALDVSDPGNPTLLSKFTDSINLTGQGLLLKDGTLYFGRTGGGSQAKTHPQLYSLHANDLSATPNWSLKMYKPGSSNVGVDRMILRQNLLFLTSTEPNDGFQIWDVSDPSNPPTRYDTNSLNIQQTSTAGFDCEGNLLFVGQRSNRALQIIGPS